MEKKSFRAFFAINIPENIKNTIITAIKPLYTHHALQQVKWIKSENWHITLCFLNTISEQQYQCIDQKIKTAIKSISKFSIEFTKLQPFPSAKKFHVVNLQPKPLTTLASLAATIEQNVITCGIPTENRPFNPHLTLGNVNNRHKSQMVSLLQQFTLPTMSFDVTDIKLFKSEPKPTGSFYTVVAVYNFGL